MREKSDAAVMAVLSGRSPGLQAPEHGGRNRWPLGPGILFSKVTQHGVKRATGSGAERMGFGRQCKPAANRILLDITHAIREFRLGQDLGLIEAFGPNVELAFSLRLTLHAEGEASLDELHRFLERDIGSRCDERVEMIGHDDECVQEKFALCAIVEDRSHKQFG